MLAYSTGPTSNELSRAALPPVIIAADSPAASARAAATVEAFGLRLAGALPVSQAIERIELQAATSAVWVEAESETAELDALLSKVRDDTAAGLYAAVVAGSAELLDPLVARLWGSPIQIVVGEDPAERVTALALALAGRDLPVRLSDVASDRSAERLRQLSDEVSRIATTLARLSAGPGADTASSVQPHIEASEAPEVSAEVVRAVIRARRLRSPYFADDLFADPAWDMLLDLLQAEIAQLRVPVSSLCIAAAVPATTALRWLKTMTDQGLFLRRATRTTEGGCSSSLLRRRAWRCAATSPTSARRRR